MNRSFVKRNYSHREDQDRSRQRRSRRAAARYLARLLDPTHGNVHAVCVLLRLLGRQAG